LESIERSTIKWLLNGESWIRYNTLIHLFDIEKSDEIVTQEYQSMVQNHQIKQLMMDIQDWDHKVLKRHNDADHPIHKLSFLAEIGVKGKEPEIKKCIEKIIERKSDEGPFQVLSNYPKNFGGSGKDEWLWTLCDAPLTLYSLAKFGYHQTPELRIALSHLISLVRDNGWPCAACKNLGKFRGPGRASAPCPYANMLMLKAATEMMGDFDSIDIQKGIDTIFWLWEKSYVEHPYLFKMGTDFRKLKVPFIWYDILHIVDVLSQIPYAHNSESFSSMLNVILNKKNQEFRFQSESVWMKWKGWEFCQKKEPSKWVTFIILRILKRAGLINFNISGLDLL